MYLMETVEFLCLADSLAGISMKDLSFLTMTTVPAANICYHLHWMSYSNHFLMHGVIVSY